MAKISLPLPARLSPLAGHLAGGFQEIQSPQIQLGLRRNLTVVEIMGWEETSQELIQSVQSITGLTPSLINGRASGGAETAILWQGPLSWLLIAEEAPNLYPLLRMAIPPEIGLVTDQSHGLVGMRLTGVRVRGLLAKGSLMDASPTTLPVGGTATTQFFHSLAFIHMVSHDCMDIYLYRSWVLSVFELTKQAIESL